MTVVLAAAESCAASSPCVESRLRSAFVRPAAIPRPQTGRPLTLKLRRRPPPPRRTPRPYNACTRPDHAQLCFEKTNYRHRHTQRAGIPARDVPNPRLTPGSRVWRYQSGDLHTRILRTCSRRSRKRGDRCLPALPNSTRPIRARGRPPDFARDRWLQCDHQLVAGTIRRALGRSNQRRPGKQAPRSRLLGPPQAQESTASRGNKLGRRISTLRVPSHAHRASQRRASKQAQAPITHWQITPRRLLGVHLRISGHHLLRQRPGMAFPQQNLPQTLSYPPAGSQPATGLPPTPPLLNRLALTQFCTADGGRCWRHDAADECGKWGSLVTFMVIRELGHTRLSRSSGAT